RRGSATGPGRCGGAGKGGSRPPGPGKAYGFELEKARVPPSCSGAAGGSPRSAAGHIITDMSGFRSHVTRPDLASLELLVTVAELGSLSAASSALGIAQPNASRQLSRLEWRLGVRVVARAATGCRPPREGRVAIEYAPRGLDAADGLVEQVRYSARRGRVRIVASDTSSEHLMRFLFASLAAWLPV